MKAVKFTCTRQLVLIKETICTEGSLQQIHWKHIGVGYGWTCLKSAVISPGWGSSLSISLLSMTLVLAPIRLVFKYNPSIIASDFLTDCPSCWEVLLKIAYRFPGILGHYKGQAPGRTRLWQYLAAFCISQNALTCTDRRSCDTVAVVPAPWPSAASQTSTLFFMSVL